MVRSTFFCFFFMGICLDSFAQESKPPFHSDSHKTWSFLSDPKISDNGMYVMYTIKDGPVLENEVIIQSTSTNWKKSIVSGGFFTADSKQVIYQNQDTLFSLTLGSDVIKVISSKVSSYKKSRGGNWLAYHLKQTNNELVLQRLANRKQKHFFNVKDFRFNSEGDALIIECEEDKVNDSPHSLVWFSLQTWQGVDIWQETALSNTSILSSFTFDRSGKSMAFVQRTEGDPLSTTIWLYDAREYKAKQWTSNVTSEFPKDFSIAEDPSMSFNYTGDKLFLKIKREIKPLKKNPELSTVRVWNYKDDLGTSSSGWRPSSKTHFMAVLIKGRHEGVILEKEEDKLLMFSTSNNLPVGRYIVSRQSKHEDEYWWRSDFSNVINIISTDDGSRRTIREHFKDRFWQLSLSPDENYLIWYNVDKHNYYSYEVSSGVIKNISSKLAFPLYDETNVQPDMQGSFGHIGWLADSNGFLVYDRFDIWMLDPKGHKNPINLSKGYGRANQLVLGIASDRKIFSIGELILISAFNRTTKENGIQEIKLGEPINSKKILLGPHLIYVARTVNSTSGLSYGMKGIVPIKARNANAYLLSKMTAEESPNYYFSKDFKNQIKLSDVHPEKKYKWLSAELINWPMFDGTNSQGVLYKPEGFDPDKRYPVLFYYYEEYSDALHMYLRPDNFTKIPHFVNKGYLVFVPDIHYKLGHPGWSACNAVVSAAQYLSQFSWVDSAKMGIMGASFGGYQTNFIVTHTSRFAAACAGASVSNVISSYGQLFGNELSQRMHEVGLVKMGHTPWERPDLYLENSPVFAVNKASTPLLLWHGSDDDRVRLPQALEMFVNMRRAGKRVWLLQYNGEGHGIAGKNGVDLEKRVDQFFDHYLKDMPAPIWMTDGVGVEFYQVKSGLEIDTSGKRP